MALQSKCWGKNSAYVDSSIFLSAKDIATTSHEYEQERLNFTWEDVAGATNDFNYEDYVDDFGFVHEACFELLLQQVNNLDVMESQCFSMDEFVSICSIEGNEDRENEVTKLLYWPYSQDLPTLTEEQAWKVG